VWNRLTERVRAVLRLDWSVFREIAADPHAFPQALVVVVAASALAGLGHGGPSRTALLGVAVNIVRWVIATALIWIAAAFASDAEIDYGRLLRCTGFADAWIAGNLLVVLPWIGWLFGLASAVMWIVALVEATREAAHVELQRALLICAIAALLSLLPVCAFVSWVTGPA
jgi:hypothetical protein